MAYENENFTPPCGLRALKNKEAYLKKWKRNSMNEDGELLSPAALEETTEERKA
jgi:hypothetical protein